MDASTTVEKLNFDRLFFTKSEKGKKDPCFVSKVKNYETDENGESVYTGDLIVIAHIGGPESSGIDKPGRYDVKCRPMRSGKGYIVVSSKWTEDEIAIERKGWKVLFLVNGKEATLDMSDGRKIPLSFDRENWYDPEKIVKNIQKKFAFLQIPREKYFKDWRNTFLLQCQMVSREYKKSKMEEMKAVKEDLLSGIDKLREKWTKE